MAIGNSALKSLENGAYNVTWARNNGDTTMTEEMLQSNGCTLWR